MISTIVITTIAIFIVAATGLGLGIILYILATNRRMFFATQPLGIITNILTGIVLILVTVTINVGMYYILADIWPNI